MGCQPFSIVRVGDDVDFRTLRLLIRAFDLIVDADEQHGIDQRGRVAADERDDGPPVRGLNEHHSRFISSTESSR